MLGSGRVEREVQRGRAPYAIGAVSLDDLGHAFAPVELALVRGAGRAVGLCAIGAAHEGNCDILRALRLPRWGSEAHMGAVKRIANPREKYKYLLILLLEVV